MKIKSFAKRNFLEIIRDPLNLCFGLGFPLVLLLLLSLIQKNIPVELFEISSLTPGITVFGLSFMTLFSATIISKDRKSSFLERLYTTPLTPLDFIIGYTLPIIPISLAQTVLCCVVAVFLGLDISINLLYTILLIIPVCFLFVSLGLLFGSILNDKQVGGVCGGLLTNLSAWLSGIWFDIKLLGETFNKIAQLLPFAHAVELERAVLNGNFSNILPHLLWVIGYGIVVFAIAILLFFRQMKK
jgi:ABC-2 type transport system permease protein